MESEDGTGLNEWYRNNLEVEYCAIELGMVDKPLEDGLPPFRISIFPYGYNKESGGYPIKLDFLSSQDIAVSHLNQSAPKK